MAVHHCTRCGRENGFEGICYYCRARAERERYQAMPPDEVSRTVQEIIDGIETIQQWDKVFQDFKGLLSCRDINTESIAAAAFAEEIYYPAEMYRDASPAVRDGLIRLLEQPGYGHADNLLQCLAVIGDGAVAEAFKRMDDSPLPWRACLHWDAARYLTCGDRCLDSDGNLVNLAYERCYALMPGGERDDAVKAAVPLDDVCGHCGCRLADILTIDGRDGRLSFLGLGGRVRIPICPNCASMCERTVVRYTPDGDSRMELVNPFAEKKSYFSGEEFAELTSKTLTLSREPVPPYFQFCPEPVFTIGGHPEWVQDPQYEDCPDCGKKMKLLSQMCWDTVMDFSEGDLFMEICAGCRAIVLVHQQT